MTIGLPVYNGQSGLERALESLLAQDVGDFRIIISDNGSTDGTPDLCRRYEMKDPRIRYLGESVNRGPTWNFNRLLGLASESRYFMWAAHDDRWSPDYASSCVKFLEGHESVALCGTMAEMVDQDERAIGTVDHGYSTLGLGPVDRAVRFARQVWLNSPFYGVYRSNALRGRWLQNRVGSDHIFLFDLSLSAEMHTLPEIKLWRRIGGASGNYASLVRSLGLTLRWPKQFRHVDIFCGFFKTIAQSQTLQRSERSRLKRELLLVLWRCHFHRHFTIRKLLSTFGILSGRRRERDSTSRIEA